MRGYEVVIGAIRKAGAAAQSAAEQARAIDLADPLSSVGTALPGSRATQVAADVARFWARQVQDWSRDSQGYAESLVASADLYAASEQEAEAHLQASWTWLGRPGSGGGQW